ncbi:hypothetical protein AS156_35010 [Bradyrhizobium macuxiense]|uniref:FecR family protein n=1 Tax=Bradyrhizobium macuxiense TaxID=1755647 RepID=A0A109JZQ9_9BRAD|nr:hypothetical protein AS156_35010 [Bradyrhizobium macuxiense]
MGRLPHSIGNVIGSIQTAIGRCTITRAGGIPVQAMVGDPVCPDDVIETAADGRIEIRFIDGTVFNLSHDSGVVLGEFPRDATGTLRSALLSVIRGAFAFTAGELAKSGSLTVDTPVGSIRGRTQASGFGLLSLAALTFALAEEAHAADPNVTFLDDDTITYKELPHGVFELVTKEAIPRHIIVEDPGETVVLSRRGSSVGINTVTNTPAQMQQLQIAQQDALANYAKGWSPVGSGASPFANPGDLLQPINFLQPDPNYQQNPLPPLQNAVLQQVILPLPTLAITSIGGQISVAGDDIINASKAAAGVEIVGATSGVQDGQIVTVSITNGSEQVVFSGTATVSNSAWSLDLSPATAKALADGMYTLTAEVTNATGQTAEASQPIRVDVTPPAIAIDTIARSNVVNADIASAGFVIAGTVSDAENGQPVTVRIVDSSGEVVDIFVVTLANNAWSVNVTSAEAKALHDGNYTVTADVSDTAGNPAPEAAQAITVDETPPALSWLPQAETGIEGTAIALGTIAATANSLPGHANSVQSLVVGGIPVGAVLTDGTNSFVATIGNTAIDVKGWNLSTLKVTPPNDTNFTLAVTATDQDANTSVASELVTVSPLAPTLSPVAAHGNENTAIAVDLGAMVRGLSGANGDAAPNSFAALVVSDIPVGATLSDGTGPPGHSFTATAGSTAEDVAGWNLSSLTITPPAEFEGAFTLQIAATERDSEGDISATVTASELVTVAPVAEPPTASTPPTLVLNENAVAAIAGVRVGPLAEDSDDTVSATLMVSHGTLHVAALSGVTVSGDDSATLTLSGNAAAVNALLAGLTYTPTSEYEGSDTLHLSVTSTDGSNTYPTAATASTAITVNPVAAPPTACAPPTLTLCENAAGVAVAGLHVGPLAEDSDDTVRATLTVSHGTLHVAGLSGVTVTGDDSAALTLSGNAAAVNALLAGLTYTPTSEYEGSDTLRLSVTSIDGSNTYPTPATASTAITVNPVAEQPTASAPPTLTLDENAAGVAIPGLRVGPLAEDSDDTVSATLTVSHGTLHVAGLSGVTVTGDDSGTLTLSGSAASVNALLAGLTYTPTTEYEGSDTLRMSVMSSDGSNTYPSAATASTAITVNPVAEPPTASAPPAATTAEDAAIDIRGVVVGPLAEDADDTVRVVLTIAHGTLTVNAVAGVTETAIDDGSLILSGSASEVNAALASLVYTPDDGFIGSDTLEISVTSTDGSNTYPTPATAATAISVTLDSESLIVGGPGPMLEWNLAANWSGNVVPTLSIDTIITAPSNYTAVVDGFSQAKSVTIPHGAASTDITATGTLRIAGDLDIIESGKFENDGILEETTSASFVGPITNNGTIIVDPGIDLDVTGTITGIGKFWIDSGTTLEFATGSKVAPGTTDSQVVYFEQGAGKLIIDDWGKFSGVITGTDIGAQLTSSDLIDLTQLPFVGGSMSVAISYDSGTNISTMTFSDGNAASNVTLRLSGNYTGTSWTFTSINGGAGTEVSDPPAGSGGIVASASGTNTGWMCSMAQNVTAQIVGSAGNGIVPMMAAGVWASAPGSSSALNALDTGDTLASMIIAGLGADLLVGGDGSNTFVYSHAVNSNAAPPDIIADFVPGSDKIDLTALGSFAPAILTLAPTSTSVPAHTIAWLYDSKSSQAIVYVNPTDHAVGIGDASLVAIHLPGVANVHLSDFVLATATAVAANDLIDLAATTQSDPTSIAIDASDAKVASGALLIDQSPTAQATGVHHSSDVIKDNFDTIDGVKFAASTGGGMPSTGAGADDAATAVASGLSAVLPHLAMLAPMQASFVFDQNPVSDSANATTVMHGAAPESGNGIAPSVSDWRDNPDANANNGDHGASPQKVVALTNAGDAHGNETDISANAVSDSDAPKTPASGNGKGSFAGDTGDDTAPLHGASAHDDGPSPPGQSKFEDIAGFNFKNDMSTPDGSAVNGAATSDDVPASRGHHDHVTPTQEASLEGGAAFGVSGDSFSFKPGNSNSKGSAGNDFAGLDQNSAPANNQKGIDIPPGETQTIGLSPHDHSDDHLNHGAHALMVHASHDLFV